MGFRGQAAHRGYAQLILDSGFRIRNPKSEIQTGMAGSVAAAENR
jgi:hypothetical protein